MAKNGNLDKDKAKVLHSPLSKTWAKKQQQQNFKVFLNNSRGHPDLRGNLTPESRCCYREGELLGRDDI